MAAKKNGLPVAESFEQIASADDVTETTVPVPEWGVSVVVRGLTRGEVRTIGTDDLSAEESEVFALVNAVVRPKLTEDEARHIVNEKGFKGGETLLNAILELSGLGAGFR